MSAGREHWGSRMGFILAATGSAVGLGNIWKYPHMAGQNGGAAFTLVYLICIAVVGLPILLAELAIGRKSQLSPVGAFQSIASNKRWKWVGFIGVAAAFVILSFYSVVGGWTLKYTILAISNGFAPFAHDATLAGTFFSDFTGDWLEPILWHLIFMSLCMYIIVKGVRRGIERWSTVLMPLLVGILLILVVRGLTLPGASEGMKFLFSPKWENLTTSGVVLALGHSFFTISLGMGTMITYGSYMKPGTNLLTAGIWVVVLDTCIALLAGIAIFTAVFAMGQDPAEGPGLIFVVLPSLFPQMAGGYIFGFLFFFLLFVAALTSAISILEVVTAYFIDQRGWSRKRSTIIFGGVITGVGLFASLSVAGVNILAPFGDLTFFDLLDLVSSKYMLPIGGVLTAVFVLRVWGIPQFTKALSVRFLEERVPAWLTTSIFIIAGLVVTYILLQEVVALF